MRISELKPGRKYKITFSDCCISGELTGKFIRWEGTEKDLVYRYAIFDFGKITGWAWKAETVQ